MWAARGSASSWRQGWRVESYIDADGDAFIDWNPVNVLAADGQALDDTLVSAPADIGTVNTVNGSNQSRRVETWTLKDDPSTNANGTYCPSATTTPSGNKWPCAHARIGIYRSGAITGTTTLNHDSVTSGPTPATWWTCRSRALGERRDEVLST